MKSSDEQKSDNDLRKCRQQMTKFAVELQRCYKEAKGREELVQLVEKENAILKEKLRVMQESISSPSGDPSAL